MASTDGDRKRVVGLPATPFRDTHITRQNSPERQGINAQTPDSMPRGEDDDETRAHSPEFHDRPGSGKYTADRQRFF